MHTPNTIVGKRNKHVLSFTQPFWMKYSLVGCAPASKDLHQVITSSFLDIFVAMMYGSVVLPVYAWA